MQTVGHIHHSSEKDPSPFQPGSMVVITLGNPREKIWGAILALAPEGLSVCGIEVNSFDDLVSLIKAGEPFSRVVFFPMHRVERMELDLPDGNIPSLSERFSSRTGLSAATTFNPQRSRTASDHGEQK